MNTALLRLASERRLMFHRWNGLSFGHDIGYVTLSSSLLSYPSRRGIWFWWCFHKHRGGAGGLAVPQWRDDVKEKVRNLIKHQIDNPPRLKTNKRLDIC